MTLRFTPSLVKSAKKTISLIPPNKAGGSYSLGNKLVLSGSSKLFLGDGVAGSKTILSFAESTSSDAEIATFNPAGLDKTDDNAGGFDYNCHLNWNTDKDNTVVVPQSPPCRNDDVVFKPENAYFVSTFNQYAGAKSMKVLGSPLDTATECQPTSSGPMFFLGSSPIGIDIPNCETKFAFNKKLGGSWKCPESSCTADATAIDGNGNTIQIFTKGSNKGKGYQVNPDGTLTPIAVQNTTNSNGDPVYKVGDIEVLPNGEVFTTTTTTTTTTILSTKDPKLSASTGTNADGAMTTIVIIVVIVAVIIIAIIIVAVVIMRKKAGSTAGDDRNIVSFENPMYDDVDGAQVAAANNNTGGGQDDGLYDDPEMSNNSGYMDVPANGGQQEQTGGYMDVAPHEEDDDEDDYEDDDNEDI